MTNITSSAAALPTESGQGDYRRYLHQRGAVFYFKARYPKDVHEKLRGKGEQKWVSLGTHDYLAAQHKLKLEIQIFESDVAKMRGARLPGPVRALAAKTQTPVARANFFEGQIPQILKCLEYDLLKEDEDFRRKAAGEQIHAYAREMRVRLESVDEHIYKEDFSIAAPQLEVMLRREKLTVPPNSKLRSRLEEAFTRKYAEVLAVVVDRRTNRTRTPVPPTRPRAMLTLMDLYDRWGASTSKGGKPKKWRTRQTYLGYVEEFAAMFGAVPVEAVSRLMVDQYRDELVKAGLERRSIENHISGLSAMVSREVQRKVGAELVHNPFAVVDLDGIPGKPDCEKRREFDTTELVRLFESAVFTEGYRPEGQVGESAFWAPLIGLFMGPRIEEIAQLEIDDVRCRSGVWVLRICEFNETQGTKNEESKRDIPIHDELLKCGLLQYAAHVKLRGHDKLFPTLRCENKNKLYSNALTKWFSRYLDRIGNDAPVVCFHSLRRNFAQRAIDCGVEPLALAAVMGHWYSERRESGKHYIAQHGKYPIHALSKAMKQIRFDELDLSALHVAEPFLHVEEAFGAKPPLVL